MPLRRLVVLLAVLAAACAPSPTIGAADDPLPEPEPTFPRETVPPGTVPPSDPPPDEPTVELPPPRPGPTTAIDGRAVLQGAAATIRSGADDIELEPATLPAQSTWSRDGERIVLVRGLGPRTTLAVFDGRTGELLAEQPVIRPYFFFSWSHDGTRIAALGPGPEGTHLDLLDADGVLLHDDVARAQSLWISWDPGANRLTAHGDDTLLRVDEDGTATELAVVGTRFYAAKWIPGTAEIVAVMDIEGTDTLVRRGVEGGDPLVTLGEVDTETSISVNPDGRTAALSILFEVEAGGGAGQRISLGPPTAQEAPTRSGRVDIIDLETGERVPVFDGPALWVEWNPTGDRLLIGTSDVASGTASWWVYAHDDPFADAADELDPVVVAAVETFVPTGAFLGSYLAFGDQYVEQPRLWSPRGDRFIYTEATSEGGWALTADADTAADIDKVGPAEVAFWSPVE